jgi:hypothetical protein
VKSIRRTLSSLKKTKQQKDKWSQECHCNNHIKVDSKICPGEKGLLFYFIFMTVLSPFCTLWMIGTVFECKGVFLYQWVASLIIMINSFCKEKDLSVCFPTFHDSLWSFSSESLTLLWVRNILNFSTWLRVESNQNAITCKRFLKWVILKLCQCQKGW